MMAELDKHRRASQGDQHRTNAQIHVLRASLGAIMLRGAHLKTDICPTKPLSPLSSKTHLYSEV